MRTSARSVTAHAEPPPAATPNRRPAETGILATTFAVDGSMRSTTSWFGCVVQSAPSPLASHHVCKKLRRIGADEVTSTRASSRPVESSRTTACGLLLSTQTVDPSPAAPVRAADRTSHWAAWFVAGSMRVASPFRKCATQTASVVAVTSAGLLKNGTATTEIYAVALPEALTEGGL